MAFQTVIYYLGYCAALYLYKDMGRVFFVPMLANMWFNLLITFEIYREVDFRWFIAVHGLFWLCWILILARPSISRFEIGGSIILLVSAFFWGTLPRLMEEANALSAIIELCTQIWTTWYFSGFLVVLVVVLRSTVVARYKKDFVDILTNPRKRFLIPLGLCSGMIGFTPLLGSVVPDTVLLQRFNIGSQLMVWGWVLLESPYFIMYERLRRQQ